MSDRRKWARWALLILLLMLGAGFGVMVYVAARTPYSTEEPPRTGICPTCHEKIVLDVWDGLGQELITDEFKGYLSRHCFLVVPWRAVWLFQGASCGCRTWPVAPRLLEKENIPKPSPVERAMWWLGLWPWVSNRSFWIAIVVGAVVLMLAVIAFRPRGRRATTGGT